MPKTPMPDLALDDRLARLGREWFADVHRRSRDDREAEAAARRRPSGGDAGGDGLFDLLFGDSGDGGSDGGDGGSD